MFRSLPGHLLPTDSIESYSNATVLEDSLSRALRLGGPPASRLQDVVAELGITDTVIYSVTFSPARDSMVKALLHPIDRPQPKPEPTPWPIHPSRPQPTPSPVPSIEDEKASLPPEPVYNVHPPAFKYPASLLLAINSLRRNSASQIASLSGGEYMTFSDQRSLEKDLQDISNRIHNYYLLSYSPSVRTFGAHTLKVLVPDFPDALIQTRKNYWSQTIEATPLDSHQPEAGQKPKGPLHRKRIHIDCVGCRVPSFLSKLVSFSASREIGSTHPRSCLFSTWTLRSGDQIAVRPPSTAKTAPVT